MNCTSPKLLKNPKLRNLRQNTHRGIEEAHTGFYVPCGQCMSCRIARTREWTLRILLEMESCDESCFITLTYDDEHLPHDSGLHKRDLQLFYKRFRKAIGKKIRYFACGEYGDKMSRPHYHAIILGWQPPITDLIGLGKSYGRQLFCSGLLEEIWPNGFNVVGTVTKDSVNYVTGYIQKKLNGDMGKEKYGNLQPPFQLQSHGIGKDYLFNNFENIALEKGIRMDYGVSGLPRYFQKKAKESGLFDMSDLLHAKAEQTEAIVDKFYADLGFSKYDSLVYQAIARHSRDLKRRSEDLVYKKKGVNENYV